MSQLRITIKELGKSQETEMTLEDFLKEIIASLPTTDNINDEMHFSDGRVFLPSKFRLIEKQ
jgi:hypothetical protein